ncbi:MAG: peptidoglycan editing factor PgeF [Burkholderiaceae bacterium]
MRHDWLIPDWPAPPHVRALCTTRAGGQSLPPYDSLNLGDHVGDDPAAVQANRAVLRQALGSHAVFLKQVHGTACVELGRDTPDGAEADACVTHQRGLACTIMVADCLPVLLTDTAGRAVAAAHAGWRGLAGQGGHGVLASVYERFRALAQESGAPGAIETIAWLGPCIGPQAFEVGPEVKAAFEAHDPRAAALFQAHGPGKWLADLAGLARLRLQALGITRIHGNDGSRGWCTVSNASRFFSHRRDGVSGRMAACIWLD